jgi:hypothetical protein
MNDNLNSNAQPIARHERHAGICFSRLDDDGRGAEFTALDDEQRMDSRFGTMSDLFSSTRHASRSALEDRERKPAHGFSSLQPFRLPASNPIRAFEVTEATKQNKTEPKEKSMKLNQTITLGAIAAALLLGAGNLMAQDNGGGPGGPGGPGGMGGFGGGGPGGMGGPGGGGNFDPAQMQQQMQQFMMQRYQEQLGITNDTEWGAIQPLIQKVMDAQQAAGGGMGGMGRMFGGRGGRGGMGGPGGGMGGPGGFGQATDPTAEALQQALDSSAPTSQIKELLSKYQEAQKAKQATLTAAQDNLRKVLTVPQEAQATLMGLLN